MRRAHTAALLAAALCASGLGAQPAADLPPTRFQPGRADGVPAVQVLTASSYGTLVQDWRGPAPGRPQWRWRLDEPLSGGRAPADILTKAGDDAATPRAAAPPVTRVLLGADSDNTASTSSGWIGEFRWATGSPGTSP